MKTKYKTHRCALDFDYRFVNLVVTSNRLKDSSEIRRKRRPVSIKYEKTMSPDVRTELTVTPEPNESRHEYVL